MSSLLSGTVRTTIPAVSRAETFHAYGKINIASSRIVKNVDKGAMVHITVCFLLKRTVIIFYEKTFFKTKLVIGNGLSALREFFNLSFTCTVSLGGFFISLLLVLHSQNDH